MTKKTVCLILVAICVLGLAGCKSKKPAAAEAKKDWYRYISAFTSGTMFRKSPVRVLFVDNAGTPGKSAAGLLEFSPSIDGTAEWTSPRELVFKPKGELKPGQDYRAVLHVGKILDLPKAYARFEFRFGVVRPDMEVTIEGPLRRGPGPAAGPGPARPRRHGRRGGEGPGRKGPRGRAGRPDAPDRMEPRPGRTDRTTSSSRRSPARRRHRRSP